VTRATTVAIKVRIDSSKAGVQVQVPGHLDLPRMATEWQKDVVGANCRQKDGARSYAYAENLAAASVRAQSDVAYG
jgi:hypothetical protein